MKKYVAFFLSLILLQTITAYGNPPDDPKQPQKNNEINIWYGDWDEGITKAKAEKKPVLIDFVSDHCPGCELMDKETFAAKEIKDRLKQDWVSIRINVAHIHRNGSWNGKILNYYELSKLFRVTGVPTFVFLDKECKPVQSVAGYKDKDLFGTILDYIKDETYKKGISFKEYRESKTNL